ncbi:MAG: hypothetical protein AUI14_20620 [Actinobacteria bacterium 13_2_20CM_2_71_6]|nr:MAG: hypothetical protein AUI14_20620 [Actinobacteria bacterium 13_2_20CM_2_71_6]
MIGLVVAAFVLLIALPAAFLIHDTSADPVFVGLDNLHVPVWAAQSHQDTSDGSRWCVKDCRLRERTWRSVKPAQATDPAYQQALTEAGWRLHRTAGCPTPPTGVYTCWQRDEYVLDLWTRDAACDLSNVAPLPGNTVPPATDPSAPAVPAPTASAPPPTCDGSLVTAKVTERANPNWHP